MNLDAVLIALRRARRLVKSGWAQGRWCFERNGVLHYCVTGAFGFQHGCLDGSVREDALASLVAYGILELDPEPDVMSLLARHDVANYFNHAVTWNDDRGRTKAEVVTAFTKTIRALEEQHGQAQ